MLYSNFFLYYFFFYKYGLVYFFFFFSSRRRHTRWPRDWSQTCALPIFKARGLTGDTAAKFSLGYAPDAWDCALQQFGASEAERLRLLQVGLVIERERKPG